MALIPKPIERDDSVTAHLKRITSSDSPLMTAARQRGRSTAQRRGLLSSTMAGQAGEQAVIETATPLALQSSAQESAKNITDLQAYNQRIQAQEGFGYSTRLTQQQIDAATAEASERFKTTSALQEQDIAGRSRLGEEQFGFSSRLQEEDIAGRKDLQTADITSRKEMLASELASRSDISEAEAQNRIQLQTNSDLAAAERLGIEMDSRTAIAIMDANTRLTINTETLTAQERFQTGSFMLEADRTYASTLSSIAANPDLPASERARLQRNASNLRDSAQGMVEALYGTKLYFAPATAPAPITPPVYAPPTSPRLDSGEGSNVRGFNTTARPTPDYVSGGITRVWPNIGAFS